MLSTLLDQWGVPQVLIQPALGAAIPRSANRFSGVAILGSDHSVHDPVPWIREERCLVRDALFHDVPLLGHCFGAQMLADAAGANVRRLPRPDIGWRMLRPTPSARELFNTSEAVPSFNWHHEAFDIPVGAERILVGQNCLNKGFRMGPHLALQCHLEVTAETLAAWCHHGAAELQAECGPTVQRASQILAEAPVWLPALHALARRVYGEWVAQLSGSPLTPVHHMPHRLDAFLMRPGAHYGQQGRAPHEHRPRATRPR
jgi:GMP synthase (glutamine-hydrolysing)